MIRRPPSSARTSPPFPDTPLRRSLAHLGASRLDRGQLLEGGVGVLGEHPRQRRLAGPGRPIKLVTGERIEIDVERRNVDCVMRSEEHTSELQSLMRISYAVFCLKKKTTK